MPVEVPCPGCGLKLKAPDNMIGKKAKCKKCDTTFRIPGGDPNASGDTVGEAQMLSVISMPSPFGPGGGAQVPLAAAAPPASPTVSTPTPAAARPGFGSSKPGVPGLPATPAAPAAGTPASKPALPGLPGAVPAARPASGSVPKPAPRPLTGTTPAAAPVARAVPGTAPAAPAAPKPAARVAPAAPAPAAAPAPVAAPAAAPAGDPFAFEENLDDPKAKGKKRDDDDDDKPRSKRRDDRDDDDDDRPRKRKSRDDDEDDDDRPRSKKKDRDEDDDDRPRSKRRDDDEDDDDRPRSKKKRDDDEDDDDRPRKRKSRDDDEDDDDRPRSKRRDDDEDDDDRPRKRKSRDDDDEDDDDRPRSKRRSRDDDDDDDDDRPRKRKSRDDEPAKPAVAAPAADPFAFDFNGAPDAKAKAGPPSDVMTGPPLIGGDPFAFDAAPAAAPAPAPKKKRDDDDDDDDRPRSKKKRDDDDDDEKPRSKKKDREEEPAPAPAPAAPVAPASGVLFAFDSAPAPAAETKDKKKNRDDDDDDKPRSKKKDDDDDKPRKKKEDDGKAPVVTADDLFGFAAGAAEPEPKDKKKKGRDDDDEPKSKRKDDDRGGKKDKKKGRDDDEEKEERRYIRPDEQKGGKKTLIMAILLGVGALGAMIAAVIMMQKQAKQREREEAEIAAKKKAAEEKAKQDEIPIPLPDPKDPKTKDPKDPKTKDPKDPKPKDKKDPKEDDPPAVMLDLPVKAATLIFQPAGAKQEVGLKPKGQPAPINAPTAKLKRIFAPEKKEQDIIAVWQSAGGPGGKGEKLSVEIHAGQTGARVGGFEFDGDGKDTKCDVSDDGKSFLAVGPDGKITIWNLADPAKAKTLADYDPYGTPDRTNEKAAGLAGVFFTQVPDQIVTVMTTGSMHLIDTKAKKILNGWSPPGIRTSPNKVMFGKNLAVDNAHASLAVAVGGTLFQVQIPGLTTVNRSEPLGDVGRHFGIGVLGVPGRFAYAFETNVNGKKEKAVLFLAGKDLSIFRCPDAVGEPTGVNWVTPQLAVLTTDKGVVYFGGESKFKPQAFAETTGKCLSAGNEDGHWYTAPDSALPTRTLFQQLHSEALSDFLRDLGEDAKPPTVKLNDKGLSK